MLAASEHLVLILDVLEGEFDKVQKFKGKATMSQQSVMHFALQCIWKVQDRQKDREKFKQNS